MKVKIGEKLAYACGDFSNNTAYLFVGTYILSFLTIGLGLGGTVAGTIIMVVTIFDAINDVVIGNIVDKLHARGTTYPKMLRMTVLPVAVLMVLLFFSPNFSVMAKIIWALVLYALYTIAQTSYQVPFGAMSSAMTDDDDERVQLGAYRDWGANVGSFLVNTFASVMILYFSGTTDGETMTAHGFMMSALVCGILLVIGGMIPGVVCKERVPVVETQEAPLAEGLKAFAKNRNAVIASIVVCIVNCAMLVRASFGVYYCIYYLENPNWISPVLSVMSIVPLVGILFIPVLTKKLDRRPLFLIAGVCILAGGIIQWIGGNLIASMIASILFGFSLCCSITVTWGAIPDIADYGEYVSGVYCPGICYSTLTFVLKLATAFANFVLGVILDAYGFESGNITANAVSGISLWYALIPIILGILCIIAAAMFNLTSAKLEEVHKELAIRHGESK